jgi:hypothetical protein
MAIGKMTFAPEMYDEVDEGDNKTMDDVVGEEKRKRRNRMRIRRLPG